MLVGPGVYAEAKASFRPGVAVRSRDGAEATVLDGEGLHGCIGNQGG